MFVLWGGSFWSKLNAEFLLFYFRLFHNWFCSLKHVTPVLLFPPLRGLQPVEWETVI